MKKGKIITSSLIALSMMIGMSNFSVFADDMNTDNNLIPTLPTLTEDYDETKQVNLKARGNWSLGDTEIFSLTESISAAADDTDDMYIWTANSACTVSLKLTSANTNYIAAFYSLNTTTGEATWMNYYDLSSDSSSSYNVNLAAGDYAIFVYSLDSTYGANYSLMLNASNPSGATHIMAESSNLSKLVLFYGNQSDSTKLVYSNGTCLTSSDLEWNRRWVLNYGGGAYNARQCMVSTPVVKGIYVGSYSSDYAGNIENALILELDEGTHFLVARTTATGSSISIDYTDYMGLETPRTLQNLIDINDSRANYLIVDLDTNEVVDFASIANAFYSLGWQETYTLPSDFLIYYQKS